MAKCVDLVCSKTRCYDIAHQFYDTELKNYNYFGDVLLFCNIFIVVFGSLGGLISFNLLRQILLIIIFLSCVRAAMTLVTTCEAETNRDQKPFTSRNTNNLWYIISGHTLLALCLTCLVWKSSYHPIIKGISLILSGLVCLSQIITREHYTVDIILTICLVFLSCQAFIKCC